MIAAHRLAPFRVAAALAVVSHAAAATLPPTTAHERRRPGPPTRCADWTGTSDGNAHFDVTATLCTRGDEVTGTIRFSDLGGSVTDRALAGRVRGSSLALRQTGIVRERVSPAWQSNGMRWCTSTTVYALESADDRLDGSYDSPACDHGTVRLARAR